MEEKEKEMTPIEEYAVIRDDDIEESTEVIETEETVEAVEENFSHEEKEQVEVNVEEVPTEFSKDEHENIDTNNNLEEIKEFQKHIEELEQLNKEFESKITELEDKISKLEQANSNLNEYKNNKIKEEKQNIINSYTNVLSEEEIQSINIDNFSIENLSDKLAAMAYRKIANHDSANFQLINTDISHDEDDVDSIIRKYKEN